MKLNLKPILPCDGHTHVVAVWVRNGKVNEAYIDGKKLSKKKVQELQFHTD
jgi:hypothetical protein